MAGIYKLYIINNVPYKLNVLDSSFYVRSLVNVYSRHLCKLHNETRMIIVYGVM